MTNIDGKVDGLDTGLALVKNTLSGMDTSLTGISSKVNDLTSDMSSMQSTLNAIQTGRFLIQRSIVQLVEVHLRTQIPTTQVMRIWTKSWKNWKKNPACKRRICK